VRAFLSWLVPFAVFGIASLAAQSARQAENQAVFDSADLQLQRALTLAKSNQLDDAKRILLEGKRRYPDDKRFPQELAGIEYRKKDIAGAKAYLREALQDDAADNYATIFLELSTFSTVICRRH
jgi:predicted Zn-dependent protease